MSQTLDILQEDNTEEEVVIIAGNTLSTDIDEVIALTNNVENKSNKPVGKKGRPVLHPFAGRITLLREEVQNVVSNPDAFIALMEECHGLKEDRAEALVKKLDTNTMDYTFCGPIELVIQETMSVASRYENLDMVESVTINFKKKKIITDEKSELYLEPVVEGKIVKSIEAYPDRIYGFVHVTFK